MMGTYDCTAGRLSAVAAALRLRLQLSSHGDVPMVKPAVLLTTYTLRQLQPSLST